MAKKIRTVLTLQLPAGKATPAPPVGTALGPHGINIVEFCKTYNERTQAQTRPGHPGPDHDLRGPQLQLHPQDAAGCRPAAQGRRRREGLPDDRSRDGRQGHAEPDPRDRGSQDVRPERGRHRRRIQDRRGHRALDGHRGRRLSRWQQRRGAREARSRARVRTTPRAEGEATRVRGEAMGRQEGDSDA